MKAIDLLDPWWHTDQLQKYANYAMEETLLYRTYLSALLSRRRSAPNILRVWEGEDPCANAQRAAIFSHHDPHGNIGDYVVHYLRELANAGLRIYFSSSCPNLRVEEIEKVRPYVRKVLQRKNVGFDFGAFKDAILHIKKLSALHGLLMTNDSVYGPLFPIRPIFERAASLRTDFWGLTDSWSYNYHLQSYFIYFERQVLSSSAFLDFFRSYVYPSVKQKVIFQGEILLTQSLTKAGFRSRALLDYRSLSALAKVKPNREYRFQKDVMHAIRIGEPRNPTHFFWDLLIEEGFPFIKRDLLAENPSQIDNLMFWEHFIRKHSDYDPKLITSHLDYVKKNSALEIMSGART